MPRQLYSGRERPGNHCIGGWVVLRAGLDIRDRVQAVNTVTEVPQYNVWEIRTLGD